MNVVKLVDEHYPTPILLFCMLRRPISEADIENGRREISESTVVCRKRRGVIPVARPTYRSMTLSLSLSATSGPSSRPWPAALEDIGRTGATYFFTFHTAIALSVRDAKKYVTRDAPFCAPPRDSGYHVAGGFSDCADELRVQRSTPSVPPRCRRRRTLRACRFAASFHLRQLTRIGASSMTTDAGLNEQLCLAGGLDAVMLGAEPAAQRARPPRPGRLNPNRDARTHTHTHASRRSPDGHPHSLQYQHQRTILTHLSQSPLLGPASPASGQS